MTEKFRFPIEGDADRVMERMPFSDTPEGVKDILKPSESQELANLMEEQAIDQAFDYGDIVEKGVSAAGKLIKNVGGRTGIGYLVNTGTAGDPYWDNLPDIGDPDNEIRKDNLRIWGRGENSDRNFSLITDSQDTPIVFYHASPNFIGRSFDPDKSQLRDPGYFGEGVYFSSRADESKKYLEKQHYFGKMSEEEKTGKYKDFHAKKKNPKIIPTYLRFEKALRLVSPEGEKGVESFVTDDLNAAEITNGLMELVFKIKGVDPTNENDSYAISEIKTNFGEASDFNTPTKIRKFLSKVGAKNKQGTELQLTQFLKTLGYDGILVLEDANRPNDYAEAVIFNREQSKHATENVGTYLEKDDLYTKSEKKGSETYS